MQMLVACGMTAFLLYLKFPKYKFAPINKQNDPEAETGREYNIEDCICCEDFPIDFFTDNCSIAIHEKPEMKQPRSLPGELISGNSIKKSSFDISSANSSNFMLKDILSPQKTRQKSQWEIKL